MRYKIPCYNCVIKIICINIASELLFQLLTVLQRGSQQTNDILAISKYMYIKRLSFSLLLRAQSENKIN